MAADLFTAQLFVRRGVARTPRAARAAGVLLSGLLATIVGTMLGTCAAGVAYAAGIGR